MSECEGCPLKKARVVITQDMGTGYTTTVQDTGYAWCPAMYETCNLTASDMTVIKSAIAGEGRLECISDEAREILWGMMVYAARQGGE